MAAALVCTGKCWGGVDVGSVSTRQGAGISPGWAVLGGCAASSPWGRSHPTVLSLKCFLLLRRERQSRKNT